MHIGEVYSPYIAATMQDYIQLLSLNITIKTKKLTPTDGEQGFSSGIKGDIGNPKELHARICEYQNVIGSIEFEGETETETETVEQKTKGEWYLGF